ncbi:MAG: hypothetical protein M3Y65_00220 [Pseudomonadota bacterium]|nr:hypothetical protein [Pseudomonadota bacterium]
MTTATFNYIAAQYEAAVDTDLDVHVIGLFLAEHGIRRTLAQVAHDLDYVYAFTFYADSHPAPTGQAMAQMDALIDSMSPMQLSDDSRAWEANWSAAGM